MSKSIDLRLQELRKVNNQIAECERDRDRYVNQKVKVLRELRENQIRNTYDLRSYLEQKTESDTFREEIENEKSRYSIFRGKRIFQSNLSEKGDQ